MTIINTNIEIKNTNFMNRDICNLCPFLELMSSYEMPRRCKIFNKYPKRFNPLAKYRVISYKYIRLDECKNCEIK